MLNCLKENKVVLKALIGLIIILLIIVGIIIFLVKKDMGDIVWSVIGISILIIVFSIGLFNRKYKDDIDKFNKCRDKNKQDKLDVINDLNKIEKGDITIPTTIKDKVVNINEPEDAPAIADWIVLKITDDGNNIIKLKTLQKHFYKKLKDLLIEQKPNTNEIDEVKIYIKKVNSLIARYDLKHPWFT
jgi:energy-coupling factor transporter transmembrane protein EcfT